MSKINLPELPPEVDTVRALFRGQPDHFEAQDYYYTQEQMRAYAEQAVREALAAQTSALHAFADRKYCIAIEYARRNEALGWESKVKNGRFGVDEYACHKNMNEAYGAHFGIYDALKQVALIREKDHGEST